MKICPKCHSVYDDDKKFCEYCGAKLPGDQDAGAAQNAGGDYNAGPERSVEPIRSAEPIRSSEPTRGAGGYQNAGPGGYRNAGATRRAEPEGERVIYTDIVPRSIPVAIILSLVTCGIYVLYWLYKLNNEMNELTEDVQAPDGLMVVIFSILTCGIYSLYWLYQMGKKCDYITGKDSSSPILFLVLGIFGLGIVSYCLIQDTINKAVS